MKKLFKCISAQNPAKFVFQSSPSPVPDLSRSPEWLKAQLKKEVTGDLGNLMDDIENGVSKEEVKQIFAEIDIATEWNNGSPKNSARYVLAIQSALHILGYGDEVGTVDAMFGGKTKAGIREFQKAWNEKNPNKEQLAEDGQPGPKTLPKLLAALDGDWEEESRNDDNNDSAAEDDGNSSENEGNDENDSNEVIPENGILLETIENVSNFMDDDDFRKAHKLPLASDGNDDGKYISLHYDAETKIVEVRADKPLSEFKDLWFESELPDWLKNCENLTNLYANFATSIPPELTNLTALTAGSATSIPPKLVNLTYLRADSVTSIPSTLIRLTDLYADSVISIPPELERLTKLTARSATSIPPTLKNLEILIAPLARFDLENFPKLKYVYYSSEEDHTAIMQSLLYIDSKDVKQGESIQIRYETSNILLKNNIDALSETKLINFKTKNQTVSFEINDWGDNTKVSFEFDGDGGIKNKEFSDTGYKIEMVDGGIILSSVE